MIESMLQKNPEKRPSVDDIMTLPKIKQRIDERNVREEYATLKKKDEQLQIKKEALKKKEEDMNLKQLELKERENKLQELKLKMS